MARLNEAAKTALRDAGVSQTAWARANWSADGTWGGDACGCPDDRCIGYHHYEGEECGCLRVLLTQYLARKGTFAEFPPAAKEAGDEVRLASGQAERLRGALDEHTRDGKGEGGSA